MGHVVGETVTMILGDDADPDDRRIVSMKDVAERAGVALSSVSRVLGGHPDVSKVMRARVLDAVSALGYEPNMLAQSLRTGATQTVGFVVGDISNPLISEIALAAEVQLNSAGYSVLLTNSGNDAAADANRIGLLRQRRVDGLLVSVADEIAPATINALAAITVPFVLVDRDLPIAKAARVHSAHEIGMAQAVQHLIELGHNRIALVSGPQTLRPSRERVRTLRRICRQNGATAVVRTGFFTPEHGEKAALELLTGPQPPTAMIAGSNQILVGVLRAIREARIDVPNRLSLVTCDDAPLAEFLTPPLATISRDRKAIGDAAASLLLEMLGGGDPRVETLDTHFHSAESCAPPGR